MIKSFDEVAYLAGLIIEFVHKSNLEFLVGGRFKLNGKAVGGYIFVFN